MNFLFQAIVVFIFIFLSTTHAQNITCETAQDDTSESMRTAQTTILLKFSTNYTAGTYSLFEAIASITILHNDMGYRYQPILRIDYPSANQIKLFVRTNVGGSTTVSSIEFDWEGTTGYQYNVSFAPLSYRNGSWIKFGGIPLGAFTCLTVDNVGPSMHIPILAEFPGQRPIIVLMFSEPVNGTFTGASFTPPLANASFAPYFPTADGFSRVYTATTTTAPLSLTTSTYYYPASGVVKDRTGKSNIFRRYQYATTAGNRDPLYVTANGTTGNFFSVKGHVDLSTNLIRQGINGITHDSDWDGRPDEIYFHGMAAFDDSLFSTSMMRVTCSGTSIQCTKLPDNDRYNNLLRLSCIFPLNVSAECNPVVTSLSTMPLLVPFNLSTTFTMMTTSSANLLASSQILITSVLMFSRTRVCIVVNRAHTTNLVHTNFFLVSLNLSNSMNSTTSSSVNTICIALKNPIDRSCVKEYSSTPNLYFIEPMLYGSMYPIHYMTTGIGGYGSRSKVPPWRGKEAVLAELVPPLLSSIILYLNSGETRWTTLRLTFSEIVYLRNDSFNITIVPRNDNILSPSIRSINVSLDAMVWLNASILEIPITFDCNDPDPNNCIATNPNHLRIVNISGFEDELFNIFVPVSDPFVTTIPYRVPILISREFFSRNNETQWKTLRLTFNRPVLLVNQTFEIKLRLFNTSLVSIPSSSVWFVNSSIIEFDIPQLCDLNNCDNNLSSSACYNGYCYATTTDSISIETVNITGFRTSTYDYLFTTTGASIPKYDYIRPHLVNYADFYTTGTTATLEFSETIVQYGSPQPIIDFSSLLNYTLLSHSITSGRFLNLVFSVPFDDYDVVTIPRCGIRVRDLSNNTLACNSSDIKIQFRVWRPVLTSVQLVTPTNKTVWEALRLTFNESVRVHNTTFRITIVPVNGDPLSLFSSIQVFHNTAVRQSSNQLDFPIYVDCLDPLYCFDTDVSDLKVTHIQGFENDVGGLLRPIVSSSAIYEIDASGPSIVQLVVSGRNVIIHFSETISLTKPALSSIDYTSTFGYSLANAFVIENTMVLIFSILTSSHDIITIAAGGIHVRDASYNLYSSNGATPIVFRIGSSVRSSSSSSSTGIVSSSSSSSSTGIVSSSSSSSSTGIVSSSTGNQSYNFSVVPRSPDIIGIEFPMFLVIEFSVVSGVMSIISLFSYLYLSCILL